MSSSSGNGDWHKVNEVFEAGVKLPFDGNLHMYQLEDIEKGCSRNSYGAFLDLGLGKTVVASLIAGYKLLNGFDRCIVMCPASLISQWVEVLRDMNYDVLGYVGSPAARGKFSSDHDFIVMSFEIFQKDYNRLKDWTAYYIVDEATILSNPRNLLWKMLNGGIVEKKRKIPGLIKPMIDKIQYEKLNKGCCLLTATPSNNPSDLYGLIKTIAPDIYMNEFQFKRLHVSEENIFGVPTSFMNLDMLKENLNSVASIRFASDHLDLPEKVYNVIEYDLDPEHFSLYEELVETKLVTYKDKIMINALEATSFYNWAQKIIVNPDKAAYNKDPKGLAILDTIVRNNPQTLLVNKYVMSNEKMMQRYADIGIGGCFGGIPRGQQQRHIKEFKDKRLRVLTVNPKSGGVGLNLQCCHHVIYPEIPVTARDFRQSEGRVYRQGQKERVIVTLLIARRTIQKTLLKRIMERDEIMNEVIPTPATLRSDLFPENTAKK